MLAFLPVFPAEETDDPPQHVSDETAALRILDLLGLMLRGPVLLDRSPGALNVALLDGFLNLGLQRRQIGRLWLLAGTELVDPFLQLVDLLRLIICRFFAGLPGPDPLNPLPEFCYLGCARVLIGLFLRRCGLFWCLFGCRSSARSSRAFRRHFAISRAARAHHAHRILHAFTLIELVVGALNVVVGDRVPGSD